MEFSSHANLDGEKALSLEGLSFANPLKWAAGIVLLICVMPTILKLFGVDFSSHSIPLTAGHVAQAGVQSDDLFYAMTGASHHALLEWSSVVISLLTAIMLFSHYCLNQNPVTPIIGIALLSSGIMDSFHTFAALRLIDATADNTDLIPFTWALSRIFNATILLAGALIALRFVQKVPTRRTLIFVGLLITGLAYFLIRLTVLSSNIPQTQFPGAVITRPYDVIPIIIFMITGWGFWRLYQVQPSLFTAMMLLSIVPQLATELHMAFGSSQLFDHHFNVAHFLKIVDYAVPFAGVLIAYTLTYRELRERTIALRDKDFRLNTILESAHDGILTVDEKGIIESANKAAEQLFGYSKDKLSGSSVNILVPKVAQKKHNAQMDGFRSSGGNAHIMGAGRYITGVHRDGKEIFLDISLSKARVLKEITTIAIVRDVTHKHDVDVERAKFIAELKNSNEELERFAYVASHDLQEPLRMVTNFSQILKEEQGDKLEGEAKQQLDFVTDGAQRMQLLINDLLDYSRLSHLEAEVYIDFDTKKQIINILNNLGDDIEHTGSEIMFGNDMPIVNGNPIRFTRVLQNLIGNGLKYQPKGSKPYIQIKAKDKTDLWEFSVEDNGIGINKKYYNKIFHPFQRLHNQREYKGTGIGLTISKKIVESWGGDLWCDSTLGKGTVFYFTIKK